MHRTLYHPAFGAEVAAQETYVPDDPDGQVGATIGLMRRYVVEDMASPAIRRDALEAIGGVDPSTLTQTERAQRVFQYVKGRLTFTGDEGLAGMGGFNDDPGAPVVEVLIRPRDMAVMCEGGGCRRVGDCDDFSMYTAALLGALGVRSSFVTVAADQAEPDRFSHVYVAAYPDGQRVPMDTSHGAHIGWEVDGVTRSEEWPITGMQDLVAAGVVIAAAVWWLRAGGA